MFGGAHIAGRAGARRGAADAEAQEQEQVGQGDAVAPRAGPRVAPGHRRAGVESEFRIRCDDGRPYLGREGQQDNFAFIQILQHSITRFFFFFFFLSFFCFHFQVRLGQDLRRKILLDKRRSGSDDYDDGDSDGDDGDDDDDGGGSGSGGDDDVSRG